MKRRVFVFIVLILATVLGFTAYNTIKEEQRMLQEEQRMLQEQERQHGRILRDKVRFAGRMHFEFRIVVNEEVDNTYDLALERAFLEPSENDIVFVHNEADAMGFPDNVIVAWPGEYTPGVIPGFHWAVNQEERDLVRFHRGRGVVSFEDFGLTYPLTITDLVDNWEQVHALWRALTHTEQRIISGSAPDGGVRPEDFR